MKKTIAAMLILVMALGLCACQQGQETAAYDGTMTDLINGLYEKVTVEISLSEPTAVDTANADTLQYYTGLTDASMVEEAVFSEALISAQAYSLCAIRVAEGQDAQSVAQTVLDGINPNKWICVGADDVQVAAYGDVVLLVMVDSGLSATLADDLMAAFGEVVGGEPQVKLSK